MQYYYGDSFVTGENITLLCQQALPRNSQIDWALPRNSQMVAWALPRPEEPFSSGGFSAGFLVAFSQIFGDFSRVMRRKSAQARPKSPKKRQKTRQLRTVPEAQGGILQIPLSNHCAALAQVSRDSHGRSQANYSCHRPIIEATKAAAEELEAPKIR